jgi:putative PIN family toxin of toxin-antitoxin system
VARPVVVFDTNLLLRAAINRRSLPAKLFFDLRSRYRLAVSTDTLNELHDVLNRPPLRQKFRTLTDEAVEQIDNALSDALHITVAETPLVSRDPKDDKFLALALESGATYLISEDKDLLVLHPYKGISILSALDFLHILEQLHRDM